MLQKNYRKIGKEKNNDMDIDMVQLEHNNN